MVNFPSELVMENTMESNEVTNEIQLGSLVPLKSQTIDLKEVNPSSISMFMFGGCIGLGFYVPLCGCMGF